MKKTILIAISLTIAAALFGQAKKPTLMVVPSDTWCNNEGYTQTYDDMGIEKSVPDYRAALTDNMDLKLVISKINELMADRGFPLKDLETTMKNIERAQAEESLITGKTTGASIAETSLDRIKQVAKADIIIEIGWDVTHQGPKATLTYVMRGLDSYSNKQIAGSTGASEPSFSATTAVLLEEAVLAHIDDFNARLQEHFDDMFENGREVALEIRVFDNGSGIDLETEYNGSELVEIIDEWMDTHTVQGRYSKLDGSETRLSYEQVRIPLEKENGSAMDTEAWARQLRKYLKGEPYNLQVKIITNGLGKSMLIIGEK